MNLIPSSLLKLSDLATWATWGDRDIEERRMIAYVSRELRKQQARIAKMPEKKTTPSPTVNVSELRHLFPQLPEHLIRQRLKDRCDCQPRYVRIPSMVTPLVMRPCYVISDLAEADVGYHNCL